MFGASVGLENKAGQILSQNSRLLQTTVTSEWVHNHRSKRKMAQHSPGSGKPQ